MDIIYANAGTAEYVLLGTITVRHVLVHRG